VHAATCAATRFDQQLHEQCLH